MEQGARKEWAGAGDGLREALAEAGEPVASFSKRERRELTAGGGAVSMSSEDCGAAMVAVDGEI